MKQSLFYVWLFIIAGCCAPAPKVEVKATIPPFPQPTINAVTKIRELHDPEVDDWMVRLAKFKQQLKVMDK